MYHVSLHLGIFVYRFIIVQGFQYSSVTISFSLPDLIIFFCPMFPWHFTFDLVSNSNVYAVVSESYVVLYFYFPVV